METLILFGAQYSYLIIVVGALWYIFQQPKERRFRIAVCAALALPLTYIVAKLASTVYYDPRPFVVDNFVPLLPHAADNGFPSDHTLLSSAVAIVIFFFHRNLGILFFLGAFLVGTARVLAGVHHFIDIFGSMIIALIVTFLVFTYLFPRIWERYLAEKFSS